EGRGRAAMDGGRLEPQLRPLGPLDACREDDVGAKARADDGGQRVEAVSGRRGDQGDLADGGEVEVEGAEQMGHGLWMGGADTGEQAQDGDRSEERRVGKECRCRWPPYR